MVTALIYNRKRVFLKIEDDSVWYGMCVVIHSYIVKGAKSEKVFKWVSLAQTANHSFVYLGPIKVALT